jgi:hypothetical protein
MAKAHTNSVERCGQSMMGSMYCLLNINLIKLTIYSLELYNNYIEF